MILDIEPHSWIILEANFISIDINFPPQFYLESQAVSLQFVNYSLGQICRNTEFEYLYTISITKRHNQRSLWIYNQYWLGGLVSLKLSTIKCQYECDQCIDDYIIFLKWKLHLYSFNQKLITNSDGWTAQQNQVTSFGFGNCLFQAFTQIQFQTKLPPHQDILIRFLAFNANSIIVDYLYGKQIVSTNYNQQIFIRNHFDPILQLNMKTTSNAIRDFEIFYTQPQPIFMKLNEGCLEQIDDKCLICQEGWILDQFQENCLPICGDGIIQGYEQCDNLTPKSNHSCYLCQHYCVENCQLCQFGICLQCIDGFQINANSNCEPLCGDGNLVPYSSEQCEQGVNGVWEDCQNCTFVKTINCKTNYFSVCLECEVGFQLSENQCSPHCGDKLILQEYEDCDDGNLQPYDGCYQCKFQCIEDCNICDRGQCILKCGVGYEFMNNNCLSICGDQVVTKEEDCDDGNKIKFDGCFQCKYSCPENCKDCYHGICIECNEQYKLLISNQCQEQLNCGDGLVQEQEECDDGNSLSADGCTNCIIEQNWICVEMTQYSPSKCTFVKAPSLIINFLNITQNKQYISIQFNQKVKVQTIQPLSETINFEILDVKKQYWNRLLKFQHPFNKQYLTFIQLGIWIQSNNNLNNVALDAFDKLITLQYPNYLNKTQKDYSQRLKILNQYLIYIISAITIVSLLLGSGDIFFEIMSILQFQQYLRYINLQYPENLEIYFSINDLITLHPLLNFIYFPQLLQFINIERNQEYSE